MVNASAAAITDPAYAQCWICYSSQPPFYEGIAVLGSPLNVSDANELRWEVEPVHRLTLGQVVGSGLCLLVPNMLPPYDLEPVCNQALVISNSSPHVNATYFVCSSGLTPHIITSAFLAHRDYCILVLLLPRLTVHPADALLFSSSSSLLCHRREPVAAITVALLLGLGATGAGTGIYSLVSSQTDFHQLSLAVEADVRELKQGLQYLTDTVGSLAEVVQQNRRSLDLAFLREGGVCAALKEKCCFFKDKTGLVRDSIRSIDQSIRDRQKEIDRSESWYQNWLSTTPWLTTLLPSLLGPFIGFLLLISFGPWAFRRLTAFVKQQIDETIKGKVQIHYQQLEMVESCSELDEHLSPFPAALDFNELERMGRKSRSFRSLCARLWRGIVRG